MIIRIMYKRKYKNWLKEHKQQKQEVAKDKILVKR